jgi:hypothetical protein
LAGGYIKEVNVIGNGNHKTLQMIGIIVAVVIIAVSLTFNVIQGSVQKDVIRGQAKDDLQDVIISRLVVEQAVLESQNISIMRQLTEIKDMLKDMQK